MVLVPGKIRGLIGRDLQHEPENFTPKAVKQYSEMSWVAT